MADFDPMSIELDQLREDLTKKRASTKGKYKQEHFVLIVDKNNLSKKALGTIESYTKDQLIDLILKGDEESSPRDPKKNTNVSLSKSIIDTAESFKVNVHGSPLNPFIKDQGSKAINKAIEKLNDHDEDMVENMGTVGTVLALIGLGVDTLFSTEKLANKGQQYLEKRSQKAMAQHDQN